MKQPVTFIKTHIVIYRSKSFFNFFVDKNFTREEFKISTKHFFQFVFYKNWKIRVDVLTFIIQTQHLIIFDCCKFSLIQLLHPSIHASRTTIFAHFYFVDCCKQSLKWLLLPSTHPSINPPRTRII